MRNLITAGILSTWDLVGHETNGHGVLESVIEQSKEYFGLIPFDFGVMNISSKERPAILFINPEEGGLAVLYKEKSYVLNDCEQIE